MEEKNGYSIEMFLLSLKIRQLSHLHEASNCDASVVGIEWSFSGQLKIFLRLIFQQDICSFGNSMINRKHWLQIYRPLSLLTTRS
jgi:hypothetical protein